MGHSSFDTAWPGARRRVYLLHGDDYVLDGFSCRLQQAFGTQLEIGATFCRQILMDDAGNSENLLPLEQPESRILNDGFECLALERGS